MNVDLILAGLSEHQLRELIYQVREHAYDTKMERSQVILWQALAEFLSMVYGKKYRGLYK